MRVNPQIILHFSAAAGLLALAIPGLMGWAVGLPLVSGLVAGSLGVLVFQAFKNHSLIGAFFLSQGTRALMLLGALAAFRMLGVPVSPLATSLILISSFILALALDVWSALNTLQEPSLPGVL